MEDHSVVLDTVAVRKSKSDLTGILSVEIPESSSVREKVGGEGLSHIRYLCSSGSFNPDLPPTHSHEARYIFEAIAEYFKKFLLEEGKLTGFELDPHALNHMREKYGDELVQSLFGQDITAIQFPMANQIYDEQTHYFGLEEPQQVSMTEVEALLSQFV